MPRAPRSLRPWITSSGILASRSIRRGSTCSVRKPRSRSRNASPRCAAAGSSSGWGWTRSRRKLPRKSSLPNDGLVHSVSRLASATCFDCSYDGFDAMPESPACPLPPQRTWASRCRDTPIATRTATPDLDRARAQPQTGAAAGGQEARVELGIDLGTANTVVSDVRRGIVYDEPTVMLLRLGGSRRERVLAV